MEFAGARRGYEIAACVVLVVALVAIPFALHAARFIGISNDDAARTLIAWDFAHHPTIDPTRSSWLPVPTYIVGAALAVTRDLEWTPRFVSLASCAIAATLAVMLTRRLGASFVWCVCAAISALAWCWSVVTAWAPGVPEQPSLAFTLAGLVMVSASRDGPPSLGRAVGAGLCFSLACGCRYESWFVGAGVAIAACATWRGALRAHIAFVLAMSIVPIAWLAINAHRSGDAFDFLHRVSSYRGTHGPIESAATRISRYPIALISQAGVLTAVALASMRRGVEVLAVAGALALLLGLVAMDALATGPTHHPDRALLACIWLTSPIAFARFDRAWRTSRARALVLVTIAGMLLQQGLGFRVPRDIDPDVAAVGRSVRRLARATDRYLVQTERLDFLWLELETGIPERAVPDRVYGQGAPSPAAVVTLASCCALAVVSSVDVRSQMTTQGWIAVATVPSWSVFRRADTN